jgi:RNA methyltransferase, TrmH family
MKPRPEPAPGKRAVTSLQNERVKFIRALEMRKTRRETGLFVAEGASVLVSARDAGWKPQTLVFLAGSAASGVYRDLLRWAEAAGAECLEVSEAVLGKLAAKENPQTMLGVFEQQWRTLPEPSTVPADAVWLVLEGIRDPGNLGTIIRTVDAVGASGIVLVGASCDPYSREAVRATMGSIFNVPLVRTEAEAFRSWLTRWPGDSVGTHLTAREDFRAAPYCGPVLLMMGSEGPGLSDDLARVCSRLVKIPMAGRLDSLNLAVATALVLYEIRRPRLHL